MNSDPRLERLIERRSVARALLACLFASAIVGERAASAHAQPSDISSTANIDAGPTYAVREETYALADAQFGIPGSATPSDFTIPVEMLGVVVAPVNAVGPRPVAVFIHGQNLSCYDPISGEAASLWPCPEGYEAVPSHRGFLRYQRFLAARGWVTVSISGNGISGHLIAMDPYSDTLLRTQLLEAHLRQWDDWIHGESSSTAPAFIAEGTMPDLQRLLVVGHSRGGSAANQLALQSATDPTLPWRVRAQVLIAPIVAHYNPAPTVPVVVLLPACDGDVLDLRGQSYVDRNRDLGADPALRTAVFIEGANHAGFNSEWDPATASAPGAAKDDAAALFLNREPEGSCRPGAPERLSGDEQRELGELYIAAAGKTHVLGETDALPLLDGSPVCAGVACRARVSTHALGGRRQPLLIPSAGSVPEPGAELAFAPCLTDRNKAGQGACITADMPEHDERPRTPHFGSAIEGEEPANQEPSHTALRLQWSAAGSTARARLSRTSLDADVSAIAVRVIVAPETVGTALAVTLVDRVGRQLLLGSVTLDGTPPNAGPGTGVYWAQEVRLVVDRSAAAAASIDFNALEELQFTTESPSGLVWVLDAWGYRPGLSESIGSAARFERSSVPVVPGAAGVVNVPFTVVGDLREPGELYYHVYNGDEPPLEGTFSVAAGEKAFELPLPVPPGASELSIQLLGVKGMVGTRRPQSVALPTVEGD